MDRKKKESTTSDESSCADSDIEMEVSFDASGEDLTDLSEIADSEDTDEDDEEEAQRGLNRRIAIARMERSSGGEASNKIKESRGSSIKDQKNLKNG